jgi:ribosomal protein S18 acetylase RimI-like enzyme
MLRGQVTFRPYLRDDRAECIAIAEGNVDPFLDPEEPGLFASFLDKLPDLDALRYAVAEVDGQVVACFGLYFDEAKRDAHFCWGLVDRAHHRRGIGRAMCAERIAWAEGREGWTLSLGTTQHTVAFYERMGFKTVKLTPDGYGPGLHRYDMLRPV